LLSTQNPGLPPLTTRLRKTNAKPPGDAKRAQYLQARPAPPSVPRLREPH